MKYLIMLFFVVLSGNAAFAQFGPCSCEASIANNSGTVNFTTLTWTGSGCPTSGTTSYVGNLCIDLGGNATINFDQNLSVNGDLKITNNGTGSVIRIPSGVTVQVNGDFGDDTNNNAVFAIDGNLIVSGGIYGRNNNAFDGSGSGTGSISAGSLNFQGAPTCTSPSDCTGINWNVGSCSPAGSSFCNTVNSLPVTLLYFNANINGQTVDLTWATATETNSSHFIIERSADGQNFDEVARVDAAGNSSVKKIYSSTDKHPLIGRMYYRLKEVDHDGYTEHFNMKFVDFSGKKSALAYPNPYLNADELTLALNFSGEQTNFVKITDLSGHEVISFVFTGSITKLPFKPGKGTYIVSIRSGNETYTNRFVVP